MLLLLIELGLRLLAKPATVCSRMFCPRIVPGGRRPENVEANIVVDLPPIAIRGLH